jgi:hypothetical protein
VQIITSLISSIQNFVIDNSARIVLAIILISSFYISFYITTRSLKKLRTEIFSGYPFDLFFPSSGGWSVGYFLIVVILLGLLFYFLIKGGFYLGPI